MERRTFLKGAVIAAATPGVIASSEYAINTIKDLISAHAEIVADWNGQWDKISDLMEVTEPQVKLERVQVGRLLHVAEFSPIFKYDEESIVEFYDRGKLSWMSPKQYESIDYRKDEALAEFRQIVATNKAIEDEAGVTSAIAAAANLKAAQERLFEILIEAKPATVEECGLKASYIAKHLKDMGEAFDEEHAIRIIRSIA